MFLYIYLHYALLTILFVSAAAKPVYQGVLERVLLLDHSGQDHFHKVINNDHTRRNLFEQQDSSYQLSLKTTDNEDFECKGLEVAGKYAAIHEDVDIKVIRNNTTEHIKGYESTTLISKDFSCVATFGTDTEKFPIKGVHFSPKNGHQEFKVLPCTDSVNKGAYCLEYGSENEVFQCGTVLPEGRNLAAKEPSLPFTLESWDSCHILMKDMHEISMGIGVGSEMYATFGSSSAILSYLEAILSQTNVIFMQQLNVKLVVKELIIVHTSGAGSITWDNPGCENTIIGQNRALYRSERTNLGLWKVMDNCSTTGADGVAVKGSLCGVTATGVTYLNKNGGTWKLFAHEVGHIFGASHSFEEGAGKTGGIMDYGERVYKHEIQFNTKYRKEEVCSFLARKQSCPHWNVLTKESIRALETCGNGILDEGEQCDCPGKKKVCKCCKNCVLRSNAYCSPLSNQCCTDKCTFEPTKKLCSHSSGVGYCRNGYCDDSECSFMGRGEYCGVASKSDPCKKLCFDIGKNQCFIAPSLYAYGRDLSIIRDGAYCETEDITFGQCINGKCEQVEKYQVSRTYFPTQKPTNAPPTEYPTNFPIVIRPSVFPSKYPSASPTKSPFVIPTLFPSVTPTTFPTKRPTGHPTSFPTNYPTYFPTAQPTQRPTAFPTTYPSQIPTPFPST